MLLLACCVAVGLGKAGLYATCALVVALCLRIDLSSMSHELSWCVQSVYVVEEISCVVLALQPPITGSRALRSALWANSSKPEPQTRELLLCLVGTECQVS